MSVFNCSAPRFDTAVSGKALRVAEFGDNDPSRVENLLAADQQNLVAHWM